MPSDRFRRSLAELPGVGKPIVQAFIMRRRRLERDKGVCGFAHPRAESSRSQAASSMIFLDKNHIPHQLILLNVKMGAPFRAFAPREQRPARADNSTGLPLRRPSLREVARTAPGCSGRRRGEG